MRHILVVGLLAGAVSNARAATAPAQPVKAEGGDEAAYYRIEDVPVPKEAYLEVGGLAFSPDGTLYACTRRGEIWARRSDPAAPADRARDKWSLFATGLHEPLGLYAFGNGDLAVAQRPELSRVRDTDGDGRADKLETLTDKFGVSGNYHEYHYGPVRDKAGNLYGTLNLGWEGKGVSPVKYRGWMYKLTPKGEFVPYALGLRSPAGIGMSPDGEIFVTDNQGDWVATSTLFHMKPNAFYGHPESLRWEKGYKGPADPAEIPNEELTRRRVRPAAWFVYGTLGHSPTEPVWDTNAGQFGPFAGQLLVGDQTKSFLLRVALEKVGGEYQGAVFMFRRGFASGITRLAWDKSHALWVGGTDRGWGATGGKVYALQTLAWTGRVPFEIKTMSLTKDGFELTFTKPVDAARAADPATWAFQHFGYKYWKTYGSPQVNLTPVAATSAAVSPDRTKVTVVLPALVKERVYQLDVKNLVAEDGTALLHPAAFYTLNRTRDAQRGDK